MKKPWSITTTLRNPERLRDFLIVLKDIEGEEWNLEAQRKYQVLLIKYRKYGYGSRQFYNGLSPKQVSLIDDLSREISFNEAENIFNKKDYEDPAMRGRQSINPLKKLGLVSLKKGKIYITDLGRLLLKDDYDLGEMFFRSFIKWQIPNLDNDDYSVTEG
ncbi:MAG: AlwI family type II restriction endonuclease, partial [Candidatus Paceibacterota bacterium]